jgi:hypothetical protein
MDIFYLWSDLACFADASSVDRENTFLATLRTFYKASTALVKIAKYSLQMVARMVIEYVLFNYIFFPPSKNIQDPQFSPGSQSVLSCYLTCRPVKSVRFVPSPILPLTLLELLISPD